MVGGGTLMSASGTWTVDSSNLTVGGGTLTGHVQHRLSSAIASMIQQRHYQHDSATTSRHGQHRLDNAIASTTRWRRR
jgi:hypothetical protein